MFCYVRRSWSSTMRQFANRMRMPVAASFLASSSRWCSSSSSEGQQTADVAPKKERKRGLGAAGAGATPVEMPKASDLPKETKAEAHMPNDEIKRQLEELARLDPEKLDELLARFNEAEDAESKVLQEDSLYQLDVSLKMQHQGGVRVFWKDITVVPAAAAYPGWYHVTIDGRKVKAFETKAQLIVPGEEFAHAVAAEWGKQLRFVNKLTMPLTDLASGAQHVSPQMIAPRIDYLMSFFPNDNLYFRAEAIQAKQDELIEPIADWYGRVFDFEVPRVVGIGHPHPPTAAANRVRAALHAMNFNQYQIVAMCVLAQCTASIMLPLALVNRVTTLPNAMAINKAEEAHNVKCEGIIEGYHDIREADQVCKLAAATVGYRLASDFPLSSCSAALMSMTAADPNEQ